MRTLKELCDFIDNETKICIDKFFYNEIGCKIPGSKNLGAVKFDDDFGFIILVQVPRDVTESKFIKKTTFSQYQVNKNKSYIHKNFKNTIIPLRVSKYVLREYIKDGFENRIIDFAEEATA